jgi:type I restriction enzyme, S subunit
MMAVATKTLTDICEFIIDCEHKTAPTQPYGYPSIRTPNIGRGRLILDGVNRVSEETYKDWTRRAVPQTGDLILAREAPVGNVAIIPDNLKMCLGQRTVLIRPDRTHVDPRYLVYRLLGDDVQGQFQSLSNGATVRHLNVADIRDLALPALPPLLTQRKIASILSAYDDLIENNTRRIAILEQMAQALYREWFVEFRFHGHEYVHMVESPLGLVPEGWEVATLEDALELQRGFDLPTSSRREGIVPVYSAGGQHGWHDEAKVRGPGVITARAGSIGTVVFAHGDFWPLNTTLWVKTYRRVSPTYAYYLLRSLDLGAINSGLAVPMLNRNYAYRLPVTLPPKELVELFDVHAIPLFAMQRSLEVKNGNLRRTRDLLLPKLISGEVDVEGLVIPTDGDET